MRLLTLNLYRYHIPLETLLPVGNQRIDSREGLVLQASTALGCEAIEIAPLSGVDVDGQPLTGFSQERLEQVIDALVAAMPSLPGQPLDALLDLAEHTTMASLAYGLSLLHAKLSGQLPSLLAQRALPRTVPLIYRHQDEPIAEVGQRVAQLDRQVHAVKVKVGQTSMMEEIQLIHQILAIRPDLKLRLDANRCFELQDAIDFLACLPLEAIEYIEEPCRDPNHNPLLFNALGILYALDESLNDPRYQFTMQAGLSALVIKPMLLGTLSRLQTIIDTAHQHGVRVIISSSLEASLGINALRCISQACTPDEVPGLDTLRAFSCDLLEPSDKARCLNLDDLTLLYSV